MDDPKKELEEKSDRGKATQDHGVIEAFPLPACARVRMLEATVTGCGTAEAQALPAVMYAKGMKE